MPQTEFSTTDVTRCICANLRLASRKVTQIYDRALRPAGITAAQFNIIATLKHCPDLPVSPLAAALGVDRTTLTRNLRPLMRRGLIESGSETDTRIRTTRLSERGQRKFDDSYPLWQAAQQSLAGQIGIDDASELLAHLDGFLEQLQHPAA